MYPLLVSPCRRRGGRSTADHQPARIVQCAIDSKRATTLPNGSVDGHEVDTESTAVRQVAGNRDGGTTVEFEVARIGRKGRKRAVTADLCGVGDERIGTIDDQFAAAGDGTDCTRGKLGQRVAMNLNIANECRRYCFVRDVEDCLVSIATGSAVA